MSSDGKLKIWGRTNSINVMKVLWACEELGLPFERVDVGGAFGGNQEASYLAMNPNGRVPTVQDKGLVLWESNVVVRYLAETYGHPGLHPADATQRWTAEMWMDWQQTTLHADATVLFWELVRTPPEQRDPAKIEAAIANLQVLWGVVDAQLAKHPYLAGPEFTMGDIPLGCAVYRWYNFDIERTDHPHLKAWYERLSQREGYRKHIMHPMT